MVCLHVVSDQGESLDQPLASDSVTIGRSSEADLQLADRFLSREHARFFKKDSQWWVEDLHSCNGTLVNGAQLEVPKQLAVGDEVRLCRNTVIFQKDSSSKTPTSTQSGLSPAQALFVAANDLDRWRTPNTDLASGTDCDLRHQAEMLHMLNDVHRALGSLRTLDELLDLLLERAFKVLAPDEALIYLRQQEGGYYRAAQRTDVDVDAEHLYSETLLREVAEKGMAALVTDVIHDPVFGPADSILARGVRSLAAAPLLDAEGSLGMIVITSIKRAKLFEEDDVELLASLASIAAMRIRNVELANLAAEEAACLARLEEELSLARQIQLKVLPSSLPEIAGYELYGANVPSRAVSGDFYTVIERADGDEYVLLMADVSGKGIAASLLTCSLDALAAGPIEVGRTPVEICNKVSRRLMSRTLPSRYATMFLGALSPSSHTFSYVNAGHNPPLLISQEGQTRWLRGTGPPLALFSKPSFEEGRVELSTADLFVFYTDGITEASNPGDDEYGAERLGKICTRHRTAPLDQLASEIRHDLDAFVEGEPYADDQTLMMLRRL